MNAPSPDQSGSPAVELSNLAFRWRGAGPWLLEIEQFTIARGERLFIRGPSGSGKSTLLNLLGGVSVPQRGSLRVLGHDLARLGGSARDRLRADHVGFIFQLHNLLPYLSMVENVVLPCRFSALRRERAQARSGGIEAEARRLLELLDLGGELFARPVTELSVGQQQRVAAARALIGSPEVIIADEPTSSLDADRRHAFLALLMAECAAQGSTLIFVSHDGALCDEFERVVDLDSLNRAAPVEGPRA